MKAERLNFAFEKYSSEELYVELSQLTQIETDHCLWMMTDNVSRNFNDQGFGGFPSKIWILIYIHVYFIAHHNYGG